MARRRCLRISIASTASTSTSAGWSRSGPSAATGAITLTVKGNIEANNGETLGQLAAAGVGVARVGHFSVAAQIASGQLVPILEEFNPGDVEAIHALFVGGVSTPARIRAFVDFLAERLR
jgi:DNA-binding transcriptional LysR family regulator